MSKLQNDNGGALGPLSFLKNVDTNFSLEELKAHLLISQITESEIVKAINEMSVKFTKKRDQITDYVLDHRQVSAYASFYLPTNVPKLHFLLSQLPESVLIDFKNRPFIDVGCGPGTFSLAWKKCLNTGSHVEMIGVDSAQIMLDQALKIMNGFYPKDNFSVQKKLHEKKSTSVLFFGHSVNEMGIDKALDLIMTVDPEYVIWIEPGTSEVFKELKKLRSILIEDYDVLYPCPSHHSCPNSWCHQVLRTSHEASVERLSQLVSLDRKILPMNAHVYKRKLKNERIKQTSATIIRFINETKFSFEYEVCYFTENENKNSIIEIPKKYLSKTLEKHFKNSSVGERIGFIVEKDLGNKLRVKIKEDEVLSNE